MKILRKDLRHGEVALRIENIDDIWYCYQIISAGDLIRCKTLRKIRVSETAVKREKVTLTIEVIKTEYKGSSLRVLGVIVAGPEEVPKGTHHGFDIAEGKEITIIKKRWHSFQISRLIEASRPMTKILICLFDNERALFALLTKECKILSELKTGPKKKEAKALAEHAFFKEIKKKIEELDSVYAPMKIILASPAFWKDYVKAELQQELREKTVSAVCSYVGKQGIAEVLKRPELARALKESRIAHEIALVERVIEGIAKGGLVAYGIEHVDKACIAKAVDVFLISDGLIKRAREKGFYSRIEKMMEQVEAGGGKVRIISSSHDGGARLDGLGGIAALLRFRIE